jgi:hypothetical protein
MTLTGFRAENWNFTISTQEEFKHTLLEKDSCITDFKICELVSATIFPSLNHAFKNVFLQEVTCQFLQTPGPTLAIYECTHVTKAWTRAMTLMKVKLQETKSMNRVNIAFLILSRNRLRWTISAGGKGATCLHADFLFSLFFRPWRWRRYVPPKRRLTLNGLHGVISQKMVLFIFSVDDRIMNEYRAFLGMRIGKGNWSTPRKPAPVPLCPPQIPYGFFNSKRIINMDWSRLAQDGLQWRRAASMVVTLLVPYKVENLLTSCWVTISFCWRDVLHRASQSVS